MSRLSLESECSLLTMTNTQRLLLNISKSSSTGFKCYRLVIFQRYCGDVTHTMPIVSNRGEKARVNGAYRKQSECKRPRVDCDRSSDLRLGNRVREVKIVTLQTTTCPSRAKGVLYRNKQSLSRSCRGFLDYPQYNRSYAI